MTTIPADRRPADADGDTGAGSGPRHEAAGDGGGEGA